MNDKPLFKLFYATENTISRMRSRGIAIWCGPNQLLVAHRAEPYGDPDVRLVGGVYDLDTIDKDGHHYFVAKKVDEHTDSLKILATKEEVQDEPVQ